MAPEHVAAEVLRAALGDQAQLARRRAAELRLIVRRQHLHFGDRVEVLGAHHEAARGADPDRGRAVDRRDELVRTAAVDRGDAGRERATPVGTEPPMLPPTTPGANCATCDARRPLSGVSAISSARRVRPMTAVSTSVVAASTWMVSLTRAEGQLNIDADVDAGRQVHAGLGDRAEAGQHRRDPVFADGRIGEGVQAGLVGDRPPLEAGADAGERHVDARQHAAGRVPHDARQLGGIELGVRRRGKKHHADGYRYAPGHGPSSCPLEGLISQRRGFNNPQPELESRKDWTTTRCCTAFATPLIGDIVALSTRPMPLAFIAGLAAFVLMPRIGDHAVLRWSFAGAALALFAWYAWARATRRRLKIERSIRPQHYLQAMAHTAIFVYWGMYWPPIQDAAPLIAGQIVFAYAFDALLSWTRRGKFVLGFGPFPIIYSTNLFLRFRDDWFYLQFLMVADRVPGEGTDPVGTRRPARPHLQPVVIPARAVLAGPDRDRHLVHHLGGRDRDAADPAAEHLPVHLPGRAARTVSVWRDVDDAAGGADDLLFSVVYLTLTGHVLLLRLERADCGVPRHAPAVHGSVHRRRRPSWDASCSASATA